MHTVKNKFYAMENISNEEISSACVLALCVCVKRDTIHRREF